MWTRGVVRAFTELGLDVDQLCSRIGVEPQQFVDPTGRPRRDDIGRLWREGLSASGDQFLGLRAAEVLTPRADHLVNLLLLSAETFGRGIEMSLRYQELLAQGRVLSHSRLADLHLLSLHRVEDQVAITPHEVEYVFGIVTKLFGFATDGAFRAREIRFQHPYRGNIEQYERVFRCPALFGREDNSLVIDDDIWCLRMSHGNRALNEQLQRVAASQHADLQSHDFVDVVRKRIRVLLPQGQCGIGTVATLLHMTPRTLQRRLRDEGTSFRILVDVTRKSIAMDCVQRNKPQDEIVRNVGYTNLRSFRRAMKRWNLSDPAIGRFGDHPS